jgi:hypothetical protein
MFTPEQVALAAPYIYYGATIAAAMMIGIGIHRALASSGGTGLTGDPIMAHLASGILVVASFVFFCIVWLACTILDPRTNHLWPCLISWAVTGLAPAAALEGWAYWSAWTSYNEDEDTTPPKKAQANQDAGSENLPKHPTKGNP